MAAIYSDGRTLSKAVLWGRIWAICAKAVGLSTVLFDIRGTLPEHPHRRVRRLKDLI